MGKFSRKEASPEAGDWGFPDLALRSLWRSRRLSGPCPPLRATLAHFCLGLQSLLCPWKGGGQREVHAQAACWPLSVGPLHALFS